MTAAPPDAHTTPSRPSRSAFVALRGLRYHVHLWGAPSEATTARPLAVMVHGWMDVGASFQFVVDALGHGPGARPIAAPDWRGFGRTEVPPTDSYWFPDYLADLDALLDALSPQQPVDLIGHSMGANVAMTYAGVRPARVRRLVNLEGFGLPGEPAAAAPSRYARWLDELKQPARLRDYADLGEVALRLQQNNPRLGAARAAWLAPHWARREADGRWHVQGDPAHKRVNPVLSRGDETAACWSRITARLLCVEGAQTDVDKYWGGRDWRGAFEQRLQQVPQVERLVLDGAGHMLHHDQPVLLAQHIGRFLDAA